MRPGIRLSCGECPNAESPRPPVSARRSSSQLQPDQPIEVRRSLDAIRRARWMIVAFVVVTTAVVVGISLLVPKTYRASSKLIYEPATSLFASQDPDTIKRNLETFQRLLTTRRVLDERREACAGRDRRLTREEGHRVGRPVGRHHQHRGPGFEATSSRRGSRTPPPRAFVAHAPAGRPPPARGGPGGADRAAPRRSGAGATPQELDAIRQQLANLSTELATAGSDLTTIPAEVPDAAVHAPAGPQRRAGVLRRPLPRDHRRARP